MHFKFILTLESLLFSEKLDEESGLSGGEESTCKGPSSSSFASDGVCNEVASKIKSTYKIKAFRSSEEVQQKKTMK